MSSKKKGSSYFSGNQRSEIADLKRRLNVSLWRQRLRGCLLRLLLLQQLPLLLRHEPLAMR